jgi:hypothetical protein
MKKVDLTLPEFGFVVATRAALGVGIGLLAAGGLRPGKRRTVGWTLVTLGALTTIPALMAVFGGGLKNWREPLSRIA